MTSVDTERRRWVLGGDFASGPANRVHSTDWLGVELSVRMPEEWEPSEIEDFGIKKIVFEGEEHPRVEFYFTLDPI